MGYFKSFFFVVTFAFHVFPICFQPVISNPYRVRAHRVRHTSGMTPIKRESNSEEPSQPNIRPGKTRKFVSASEKPDLIADDETFQPKILLVNNGKVVSEPENLEPIEDDIPIPKVDNVTSVEDDSVTSRKLKSIKTPWKNLPSDYPQESIDLTKISSYTFSLEKDESQINFIGSRFLGCTARIKCGFITVNKHNPDDMFVVSDGFGGEDLYLYSRSFDGPKIATQYGTDLYVRYKGKSPTTKCTVRCLRPTERKRSELSSYTRSGPKISYSCRCGMGNPRKLESRVVGGQTATPFEFPYQIAVVYKGTRISACGASLINDRYALSAAHCWYNRLKPSQIEVLLHAHLLDQYKGERPKLNDSNVTIPGYDLDTKTDEDEQSLRIPIEEVISHPLFNFDTVDYDFALLRLKEKIDFEKYPNIKPVCLQSWTADVELKIRSAIVSGWGLADEDAEGRTRLLQKLSMQMSDHETCVQVNKEVVNITARMICGGYLKGGQDACNGDSGGPLVTKSNGQFFQIGVVSYGDGCARKNRLGIYSNVGEMAQWIYRTVHSDATWCGVKGRTHHG